MGLFAVGSRTVGTARPIPGPRLVFSQVCWPSLLCCSDLLADKSFLLLLLPRSQRASGSSSSTTDAEQAHSLAGESVQVALLLCVLSLSTAIFTCFFLSCYFPVCVRSHR